MKWYRITLKSDTGKVSLKIYAENIIRAIHAACLMEKAPFTAVMSAKHSRP